MLLKVAVLNPLDNQQNKSQLKREAYMAEVKTLDNIMAVAKRHKG
jgi:hypothetical protein